MASNDTSIDPNALVEEVFGISTAIQNANTEADEAKRVLEDKRTYLRYIKAETYKGYRTGQIPIEGLLKPSGKDIDSIIDAHPDVHKATQEMNEALYEYNIHSTYADSMDAKKKALEMAVKFALGGWFSDLKITDASSIEKFAGGITTGVQSDSEQRAELREKRRARREKSGE